MSKPSTPAPSQRYLGDHDHRHGHVIPNAQATDVVKNSPKSMGDTSAIAGPPPTMAETPASITLRGVRTHNLKSIDLDLPLKRMIVVTGPSGAGKSSLALDTLYAEGSRRYVETFSPYTRQFLARLDKPDAELIAGIPPAIAVRSPRVRHSPRSTVGTITEVHHALGSLFARAGEVICRQCGQHVAPASPETVARAIEEWPEGTRYEIAFPMEIRATTDQAALLSSLRARGFTRLRVGDQSIMLDGPDPPLPLDSLVDVVVDRLVRGSDRPDRRTTRSRQPSKKGWAAAGSLHSESRARMSAAGDAAIAEPTTSSRSLPFFAITARSGPVRCAKAADGRCSLT